MDGESYDTLIWVVAHLNFDTAANAINNGEGGGDDAFVLRAKKPDDDTTRMMIFVL